MMGLNREEFYEKSTRPELCALLFEESMAYFKEHELELAEHEEKSLLNHIAEMVKRDQESNPIVLEDKSVFGELSQESFDKAKEIVDQLKLKQEDEIFLLAVHFESAKF